MDKQTEKNENQSLFNVGSPVIYGLHGKCSILAIEAKQIGGEQIHFYKLEPIKNNPVKQAHARPEPAIWLPVLSAKSRGLRAPMTTQESAELMATLTDRDHFFNTSEAWSVVYPKLESAIRNEGHVGLGKVLSYLYVLKKKHVVFPIEIAKFYETVSRLLFREISEAQGITMREIEEKVIKALKNKQTLDQ